MFPALLFSQEKQSPEQYVEKYYKIAIKKMKTHKIPASITLAQGILESNSGNSKLAVNAKNHFGIKCHKDWKGEKYYMDDDAANECFRVYKTVEESFEDHSLFLTSRGRYAPLFTDYSLTDYKGWANGLKAAGYATNPKYAQLLINLIEKYHLYKYDRKDFVPETKGKEDVIVNDERREETYDFEQTDEYIKALMGRNVYFTDREKGIFIFNRIKTIKSKGRTPLEIAIAFDMNYELILKYNEINAEDVFQYDQNVFLQPKRFQGSQKNYVVKPGDSMWDISQMFGIKLSSLYEKNLMNKGEEPKPGETINLKHKRKEKISTISKAEVQKEKNKIETAKPKKIVQQTVVKPTETTININITDHTQSKTVTTEVKELKKENVTTIDTVAKYPKNKYVEKNDKIEQKIESIPTVTKETKPENGITPKVGDTFLVHTVQQGETLYFLSKKYNISIEELKKINNLQDYSISIGQELIISHKE